MKYLIPALYFLIPFTLVSCSSSDQQTPVAISKAGVFAPSAAESKPSIAFIYDYLPQTAELEWKALEIKESTGDQLTDAIKAFLTYNQQKGYCPHLRLETISNEKNTQIVAFSGQAQFKTPKDSTIFWTAMDMTISRNTENTFLLEFN